MNNKAIKWTIIGLAVLILFMPNAIRLVTVLYYIDAEQYVKENLWINQRPWLHYAFSYIELFSVFAAMFVRTEGKQINFKPIFALILTINVCRVLFSATSIFSFNDYSILLSLLSGYGCYLLLSSSKYADIDVEDLLDTVIILNTITQILFVFTGRQMEYGGRYGALGSDVGTVGTMCSQYLLYFLFCRNSTRKGLLVLMCCLISLILSGSRTNLLFAIAFTVIFSFNLHSSFRKNEQISKSVKWVVLIAIVATPLLGTLLADSVMGKVIDRMLGILSAASSEDKEYFDSDGSMVGRLLSFNAGFGIISDNPLGISSSTIDLQLETIAHGYVSFPHSTIMSYYILWGFAALIIYFYIIKWLVVALKDGNKVWMFLLFLIITSTIYGAPTVNAKNYFWYFLVFTHCRNNIIRDSTGALKFAR